jgi:hypothetical protein
MDGATVVEPAMLVDERPMLIGEAFAGDGVDAAHSNVIFGSRDGPVGTAWQPHWPPHRRVMHPSS